MIWFLVVLLIVFAIGIASEKNEDLQKVMLSSLAIVMICLLIVALKVGGVA